jgi:hypothetical protein
VVSTGGCHRPESAAASGREIKLIDAPTFIATKLEAFKGRGMGDFLTSHDIEDIITVVDGRPALGQEIREAVDELRTYIVEELRSLVKKSDFLDALAGHLPGDSASQARLPTIISQLSELTR